MWRKAIKRGRRPRLGLALSGGAARGIAHVGVLKVFGEAGLIVDCVAGTSAGALVGGALAAGMPLEEIEEVGRSLRWRDLGRMTLSRLGVQSNARMEEYIRARFPATRFEELSVPFAAVATDLRTGAAVVMRDAVGHLRWDEMGRAEEFIEAGAVAARAALPAIRELLEPQPAEDSGWFPFRRSRDRQAAKD